MIVAASDLTGWWIGWGVGAVVVVVVAAVLLAIIFTARRIAGVAEDATRSLVVARDRTEALWKVRDTKATAIELLEGATKARMALGDGGVRASEPPLPYDPVDDLRGERAESRPAVQRNLQTGGKPPDRGPDRGKGKGP
ncbi:MAG: hypothetical protein ABR529_07220 [Actinomycetota bacterium]